MKNRFQTFVLLILGFSIVFGGSACRNNVSETANENTRAGEKSSKPSSEYPEPPTAIVSHQFDLLGGKSFTLEEQKGKVVLINIWATWCGPCRDEMPDIVKMQDKYREKGFLVVGLDADPETEDEIANFKKEMNLNYELGWAGDDMMREFLKLAQMDGIPQSYLIDRNGRLRAMFRGGGQTVLANMKEKVDEVVNETS
ncbi:MAG: TlpA disulfide reductase family protein [Pyrinomonadaceae bacterium]